MINRNAVNKLW